MNPIKLVGNDAVDTGVLEVNWGGNVSPLSFEFTRTENGKLRYEASFNLSRSQAKKLAIFILENL